MAIIAAGGESGLNKPKYESTHHTKLACIFTVSADQFRSFGWVVGIICTFHERLSTQGGKPVPFRISILSYNAPSNKHAHPTRGACRFCQRHSRPGNSVAAQGICLETLFRMTGWFSQD